MLGYNGTMYCPFNQGFVLIKDENECKASAESWGKPFSATGCFQTIYPGCVYNGENTYFSTCYNFVYNTTSRYASVCKGKYIEFMYFW